MSLAPYVWKGLIATAQLVVGRSLQFVPSLLTTNGAISARSGSSFVITKAGIFAGTLAAPVVGTDDGLEITITSNTAFAHTVTATGLFQSGSASVNLATFAAFAGASITIQAYQGKWNVVGLVGVTLS